MASALWRGSGVMLSSILCGLLTLSSFRSSKRCSCRCSASDMSSTITEIQQEEGAPLSLAEDKRSKSNLFSADLEQRIGIRAWQGRRDNHWAKAISESVPGISRVLDNRFLMLLTISVEFLDFRFRTASYLLSKISSWSSLTSSSALFLSWNGRWWTFRGEVNICQYSPTINSGLFHRA